MTHEMAFWFQSFWALLRRPGLWPTAFRQMGRMARPRWWSRSPFLPLPDAAYVRFRLETAYGREQPRPDDLVRYLRWCRDTQRTQSTRRAS